MTITVLTLKDMGSAGVALATVSTCATLFYTLGVIITVAWRPPRLTLREMQGLMSHNRRFLMIAFMASMLLTDFFSVHAWRLIAEDGACTPSFDWFTLWGLGSMINVVFVITAWLYPPYTLAMLRTVIVSAGFLVMYFIASCLARGEYCGSMFVAAPSMVLGVINIVAVPDKLCVFRNFEEEYDIYSDVEDKVARMYTGAGGGSGSISVFYGKDISSPFTEEEISVQQPVDNVFEEVDVVTPEEREIIRNGFPSKKSMDISRQKKKDGSSNSFSTIKNMLHWKSAHNDVTKEGSEDQIQVMELEDLKGKGPAS